MIAVHAAQDGARYERQPSRLEMKKLLLAGVAALFLAALLWGCGALAELSQQPLRFLLR